LEAAIGGGNGRVEIRHAFGCFCTPVHGHPYTFLVHDFAAPVEGAPAGPIAKLFRAGLWTHILRVSQHTIPAVLAPECLLLAIVFEPLDHVRDHLVPVDPPKQATKGIYSGCLSEPFAPGNRKAGTGGIQNLGHGRPPIVGPHG
jgi:hypothetical protein